MRGAFGDGVVGEVNFSIFEVLRGVLGGTKADIALLISPDPKRFEICEHYPLPNIKFPFLDDQWVLDVFLNHPRYLLPDDVV